MDPQLQQQKLSDWDVLTESLLRTKCLAPVHHP